MEKYILFVLFTFATFHGITGLLEVRMPATIERPSVEPPPLFIEDATAVKLDCMAKGEPTPRYTWEKNGQAITDNRIHVNTTTGTLAIESVNRIDEGLYQCLALNTWGTSLSQYTQLVVRRIYPFPDEPPQTVSMTVGESASLPCRNFPSSKPPGRFSWVFTSSNAADSQSRPIPSTERIAVDLKGTLHFAHLMKSDDKVNDLYTCALQDQQAKKIVLGSKTLLQVKGSDTTPASKPTMLASSSYVVEEKKKDATLECVFGGNPVPDITWYDTRRDKITPDGKKFLISEFGRRLTVQKLSQTDEGNYTCSAENNLGKIQHSVFLNVTSKPQWIQGPGSKTVVEGRDAEFQCKAEPALREWPLAPPMWSINGNAVNYSAINTTKFVFTADNKKLTIKNVSRDSDIMCLQCKIDNERGFIFKDAYLNVILPITIAVKPMELIIFSSGETVNLTVMATTDPSRSLSYRWEYENKPFTPEAPDFYFIQDTNELYLMTSNMTKDEAERRTGHYACHISHDVQQVTVSFTLKMAGIVVKTTTTEAVPEITTEGDKVNATQFALISEAQTSLWYLPVIFGILLLIGVVIIIFVLWKRNPGKTYFLEKKELRNKLDPVKDLQDNDFQDLGVATDA